MSDSGHSMGVSLNSYQWRRNVTHANQPTGVLGSALQWLYEHTDTKSPVELMTFVTGSTQMITTSTHTHTHTNTNTHTHTPTHPATFKSAGWLMALLHCQLPSFFLWFPLNIRTGLLYGCLPWITAQGGCCITFCKCVCICQIATEERECENKWKRERAVECEWAVAVKRNLCQYHCFLRC